MKSFNCIITVLINSAMLLLIIFSLSMQPTVGDDGFSKKIVDYANRTITLDKTVT